MNKEILKESLAIAERSSYLTSTRYISGRIVEYDIRSANISCLREANVIDEKEYQFLNSLPKNEREIQIGLKEKNDPKIYPVLQEYIKQSRLKLVSENNIAPEQIVRIANDAVYINTPVDLGKTKFGNYIEFRPKSVSNVMAKLLDIIFYIAFLPDGNIDIDIKGLGKNNMQLHGDYMINGIVSAIAIRERTSTVYALNYLSELCENYVKFNLPVEYYRELNSNSQFRLNNEVLPNGNAFYVSQVNEEYKPYINIDYNYTLLRELYSILIEMYNMKR